MATKKDLVEAYAFSRRRLVTAFVSGAPGGREVEPARPGRTVVGGVALAVLLVAGAAIAGVFQQRDDIDWQESGLVIDDDTGALYVILDELPGSDEPPLRPVVNVTSARLILGYEVEPTEVSGKEIAEQPKGPPIGIVNAPATVPGVDQLINTGWTACTGDGLGVKVDISTDDKVITASSAGLLVSQAGETYLIATAPRVGDVPARAYRYRFPDDAPDQLYLELGVDIPSHAIEVPEQWLDLFPEGEPLGADGLAIQDAGDPLPDLLDGYPARARIGDYFERRGQTFVLTRDGVAPLDPFAEAVLSNTELDGYAPQRRQVPDDAELDVVDPPYAGSRWPAEVPDPDAAPQQSDEVCAVGQWSEGQPPAVAIGLQPEGEASAETSDSDRADVTVEPGHGAVYRSGTWSAAEGGSPHLIDDRGILYALRDDGVTVDHLGYAGVPEVVVPDSWQDLFVAGVELSRDAALCPPAVGTERPRSPCG